jgi:NADH-quinone oxidoreductase subunit N
MAFDRIASSLAAGQGGSRALLLAGLALTVVGVGFKLAAVPFHMWTPDVYEGAPTPVTAFIATVSKGGVLALLIRLFIRVNPAARSLFAVLAIIAVASMLGGNLLALLQRNVKRILAYSSIGHLGYLLVAFLAGGALGVTAATFYLATYFLSSLGAFGVVGVLSGAEGDADNLDDYRGLFWRRPWLAGMLSITLFSLAGIPLTAGFVGKFLILTAGVGAAYWLLAIILVVSSVIGLFYYLRIIVAMILQSPAGPGGSKTLPPRLAGSLVLAALALALVGLGVYPGPLVQLIRAMVENL